MNRITNILLTIAILIAFAGCSKSGSKKTTREQPNNYTEEAKISQPQFNTDMFFQSALDGNLDYVREVIQQGLNVNTPNTENRTALMLAAFNGHEEMVRLLIENGADVNWTDNTNRTALMFASTGPFNSTVKILLDNGAKPNTKDAEEQWTAVMFAAAEGQLEVIKTLIENGADLTMVDIDGESCYDFAAANGHMEVAAFLKEQEANN